MAGFSPARLPSAVIVGSLRSSIRTLESRVASRHQKSGKASSEAASVLCFLIACSFCKHHDSVSDANTYRKVVENNQLNRFYNGS